MTDVHDLLRRVLDVAEDYKKYYFNELAGQGLAHGYDPHPTLKEAHEYLDGLEQRKESLKNANSLREAMGDEAYDQAMNAALFDIRLTRLEGVVRRWLSASCTHRKVPDDGTRYCNGDWCLSGALLRDLKEAE